MSLPIIQEYFLHTVYHVDNRGNLETIKSSCLCFGENKPSTRILQPSIFSESHINIPLTKAVKTICLAFVLLTFSQ